MTKATRHTAVIRAFQLLSWLPLGVLLGLMYYVRQHDGWGGWGAGAAAAPVLRLTIIFSAVMGALGIAACMVEARRGRLSYLTVAAAIVAASPAVWFAIRVFMGR